MDTSSRIKQLKQVGGSLWERSGKCRIYFNDLTGLYGLQTQCYNTGNISAAWLDGAAISNSSARRITARLSGKLWWDAADGQFHAHEIEPDDFEVLVAEIERRAAEMAP